jgi:hypothetical protein
VTEEILRILLADLATVRIKCAGCGVISEMPIGKLSTAFGTEKDCPHCHMQIAGYVLTSLCDLSRAIGELLDKRSQDQIAVEFVATVAKRP